MTGWWRLKTASTGSSFMPPDRADGVGPQATDPDRRALAEFAVSHGEAVPAAGNRPRAGSDDPESLWFVERGALDVFSYLGPGRHGGGAVSPCAAAGSRSARLWRARRRGVCGSSPRECRTQSCRRIPAERVFAGTQAGVDGIHGVLAEDADDWIGPASPPRSPRKSRFIRAPDMPLGEGAGIEARGVLTSAGGVVWLRGGAAQFFGTEEPEADDLVPLTRDSWATLRDPAVVDVLPSRAAGRRDAPVPRFARVSPARIRGGNHQSPDAAGRPGQSPGRPISVAPATTRTRRRGACSDFLGSSPAGGFRRRAADCCAPRRGAARGYRHPGPGRPCGRAAGRVRSAACIGCTRPAGCACRPKTAGGAGTAEPCWPSGTRAAPPSPPSGDDGAGTGCTIRRPAGPRRVGRAEAATLAPDAYVLYRPLPADRPVGAGELLAAAAGRSGADLARVIGAGLAAGILALAPAAGHRRAGRPRDPVGRRRRASAARADARAARCRRRAGPCAARYGRSCASRAGSRHGPPPHFGIAC